MLTPSDLAAALPALPTIATSQTYARRVPAAKLFGIKGPLPAPGRKIVGISPDFFFISGSAYRYNPPGLKAIYLGEGESTAGAEVKQHPGARGFDVEPRSPDVIYHTVVKLGSVLDLTSTSVQSRLQTTTAELVASWRLLSPNAPTQLLGKAAFDVGRFEALIYPSAAKSRVGEVASCIVIFPDRKTATSLVSVYDSDNIFLQAL